VRFDVLFFRTALLYIVDVLDGGSDAGVRIMIVHILEKSFRVEARRVDFRHNVWFRQLFFEVNIVPDYEYHVIIRSEYVRKRCHLVALQAPLSAPLQF
jgi:hypothetical protein